MIDAFFREFGSAIAQARHELLGGWFGRAFELNPANRRPTEQSPDHQPDHDPLGRTRDLGIDR